MMGKRGPRPKPAAIARLEGNPGKRLLAGPGIEATGRVVVPSHLDATARACIEEILASMPPGFYAPTDVPLLTAFAVAWSIHRRAVEEIRQPGFQHVITSTRGLRQPNGWLRILNQQAELMASLGDRLGLNPKARAALQLPQEKPKSKFAGLLGPLPGRNKGLEPG